MMDTGQDDSSSPQEVPPEHQQPSTSTDAAASDHNVRDASTQDKSQKEDEEQHEDATTTGSAAAADKDDVDDDDDGEDDEEEGKDEEQHVSVEAFERMNLYDVLQVDKTASVAKIRRAYYKLCLKNHPDRNPEDKKDEAARRFQRISHAYNVLSDAVRRHIYDTQGDGTTASSSSRSSDKLRALHTGDQEFLAMDFAIRFKEFLPLLELIPAMEKRYGFKSGEVQLDVPGMGEEQCPGDATCDIISLPHPTQRLSLALCLSHKRLHQHTAACHTSAHACILLARCLQREWKEDVHRNWVIQQSMPDDPVRPNYPYWFNIRSGVSSWCTTDDGSDTTPPAWATQDHECTKDECGSFGFTRLMDNIWICRRSGTLHLCTPTQCHYREPAPQAVVARISMPASASTTPAAARARPHRTPTSTTPRTHQHQKHKQPQAQDASSAPKQASATEPAMAPATAANTAPTPQTEQQQQQQQKKKKKKPAGAAKVVRKRASVLQHFEEAPLYGCCVQQQQQQQGRQQRGCVVFVCGGGGKGDYGVPNALTALHLKDASSTVLATHVDKRGTFNLVASHPNCRTVVSSIDGDVVVFDFDGSSSFKETATITADFDKDDAVVAAAVFSPSGRWLATGGEEGVVRVWPFPALEDPHTIRLGSKVESLAFDASGKLLACARRGSAEVAVWHTVTKKMHKTISWRSETHVQRACAFARIGEHDDFLFTASNARDPNKDKAFVVQWDAATWAPTALQPLRKPALTTLATSPSGQYCAVGDVEGGVTILDAETLKVLVRAQPHVLFVTSLAFVPPSETQQEAVISVSGDQACFLTPVKATPAWQTGLLVLLLSVIVGVIAHFIINVLPAATAA